MSLSVLISQSEPGREIYNNKSNQNGFLILTDKPKKLANSHYFQKNVDCGCQNID